MTTIYKIPMSKTVLTFFLLLVACVAAGVAWSFNSGLTWTAICLIAVAGPLALFYWYMLYITPKRASITVAAEGILLAAPPFASAVIPWASVVKTFPVDLKKDEDFKFTKTRKYMTFGGYKSGVVEIKDGMETVIVTNRPDVLCIQTDERFYLLGPSDLPGFVEAVEKTAP
ncbi:PH domain-containing protein [Pseudodesulfovibrio thermohalotolerans]|uniref:PH domain-containing protein n=1 Tax=Pseudodesulfovibrio thermohalotolerans TaxID=2880651 RepID=UPI002442B725|nr:PH domain-containing protein [Pseudodesulfovibrio thermohalotolerans]WFS61754.1 PH domain-containing protein [Pseudodesulfovibrio thermohalotolerans]